MSFREKQCLVKELQPVSEQKTHAWILVKKTTFETPQLQNPVNAAVFASIYMIQHN